MSARQIVLWGLLYDRKEVKCAKRTGQHWPIRSPSSLVHRVDHEEICPFSFEKKKRKFDSLWIVCRGGKNGRSFLFQSYRRVLLLAVDLVSFFSSVRVCPVERKSTCWSLLPSCIQSNHRRPAQKQIIYKASYFMLIHSRFSKGLEFLKWIKERRGMMMRPAVGGGWRAAERESQCVHSLPLFYVCI